MSTTEKPVLDWPGIIAELHRRGMTLTGLAQMHGVGASLMRKTKQNTNFKCQAIIADFIGHKPEKLWPSRYPKGKSRILDTQKYPQLASQKSADAADNRDAA